MTIDILNLRTSANGLAPDATGDSSNSSNSSNGTNSSSNDNDDGRTRSPSASSDASTASSGGGASSLKQSILAGLRGTEKQVPGKTSRDEEFSYSKTIPTMVLYDDKGLDIYDAITQSKDYYLFDSELAILRKYGKDIARKLFASQAAFQNSLTKTSNLTNSKPAHDLPSSNEISADNEENGTGSPDAEFEDTQDSGKDSGYQSLPNKIDIDEKWGDGRVGKNNYGVNGNLGLDDSFKKQQQQATGSVIELGAGSLKKTSVLLRALASAAFDEDRLSAVNYYALDLEHGQLVSTLTELEAAEPEAVTTSGNTNGDDKQSAHDVPVEEPRSPGMPSFAAAAQAKRKIHARGICASYDDALPYLKQGKLDNSSIVHNERKSILFLGSSIGNYSRSEAVEFLRKISDDAMVPGDTLLIGIDANNDQQRIERAYNDDQGVTRDFILNGVDHVNRILGDAGLKIEQFEYVNRYNTIEGRNEAYLKVKDTFTVSGADLGDAGQDVTFTKDELIAIERSYKYTLLEALELFSKAGLRLVQKWTDDQVTDNYHLYLLEKPLFHFPSTHEALQEARNPFGPPTLEEWDSLWKAWDCVTLSMIPRDLLHSKPIDLRHICLFYLGHIPGFLDIQMSRYLKERYTEPAHFPDMFERGIDPNMDDPSKVHAHSVVPTAMEDWPAVEEIVEYRDRVRARLQKIYKDRLLLDDHSKIDTRLVRTMQMVYEHEVMHLETLLYMCCQIAPNKLIPAPSFIKPDWTALSKEWDAQVAAEHRESAQLITEYPASKVQIGHDDFDHLDNQTPYDPAHTFGWDNESPSRSVGVPAFKISLLPVNNAEYHKFWQSKPESEREKLTPGSWSILPDGKIAIKVLTEPSLVPIEIAKDWPVMGSGTQLAAYAKSVGGRLPTEPELRLFQVDNPVDHVGANIGFVNWHPVPARLPTEKRDGSKTGASNGGVWEWTSTDFAAYDGWRTSELYPGYSEDFFDGCHAIMLGGSFATIPRVAGRTTFTNWYQRNYPYVFVGCRVAYDA